MKLCIYWGAITFYNITRANREKLTSHPVFKRMFPEPEWISFYKVNQNMDRKWDNRLSMQLEKPMFYDEDELASDIEQMAEMCKVDFGIEKAHINLWTIVTPIDLPMVYYAEIDKGQVEITITETEKVSS